jgi:hypothetical protein
MFPQAQQTVIHEDFIAQCMDILRSSYDTVSMLTQAGGCGQWFGSRIWIGSGFNQVSGSVSGSRRAKMTHKSRIFLEISCIQLKMLDPDPYQMNTVPKPWFLQILTSIGRWYSTWRCRGSPSW